MTAACNLLEAELALDRIDAELAAELPAHLRAFAAAFAADRPPPPAPAILRRASTFTALRNVEAHPILADRALAIARVAIPIAIDDDPRVVAARSVDPTWDAYAALSNARDAVARERFGTSFVTTLHALHGVPGPLSTATAAAASPSPVAEHRTDPRVVDIAASWPGPIPGWRDRDGRAFDTDVAWQAVTARFGLQARAHAVRFIAGPRARTVVVEPLREVIVVTPPTIDSPAARFAVHHEFGHAVIALSRGLVSRVVDEAAASYVARAIEVTEPLAIAARRRRTDVAAVLDAIERGASTARPTERPPWAFWHDPAAQAAYVEAEVIADRWVRDGTPFGNAVHDGAK